MLIEFKQLNGVSAFYRLDPEKDNFYSIDECVYMEHIESEDENITLFMGEYTGEEFASYWCDKLNSKKCEVSNNYVALDITESEDDDDDTLALKKFILAHETSEAGRLENIPWDRVVFNPGASHGIYETTANREDNTLYYTNPEFDWGDVYNPTVTRTVTTTAGTGAMHGWVTTATGDWRTI